ncbi:hypothetical protein MY563_09435 [Haemophilus influenzae]|nr:hypothetical protein [Haemophilus influenzae]
MLEIIDKSKTARNFIWAVLVLSFICVILWLSPDFLDALGKFLLIQKGQ